MNIKFKAKERDCRDGTGLLRSKVLLGAAGRFTIEELRPDLLFLDIELPGLTGFEVLQSVQRTVTLPLVIFVTGYDQHALPAFEGDALAYLLKPVAPERLAQVLDRARQFGAAQGGEEREREHILRVARGYNHEYIVPLRQIRPRDNARHRVAAKW